MILRVGQHAVVKNEKSWKLCKLPSLAAQENCIMETANDAHSSINKASVRPLLLPGPFCARCESIGHEEPTCPFPDDNATRTLATRRRTRRANPKPVVPDNLPPVPAPVRRCGPQPDDAPKRARPLPSREARLKALYHELAYCRMKLSQVTTKRLYFQPQWRAFYLEECARLRRCTDTLKPKVRPAPTGDVWRQMLSWITPIIETPVEIEEKPW